jgi:hypothetical protein
MISTKPNSKKLATPLLVSSNTAGRFVILHLSHDEFDRASAAASIHRKNLLEWAGEVLAAASAQVCH